MGINAHLGTTSLGGGSSTPEINDLTVAVTWADVPDANITEGSVTQHEAAINHDALLNALAAEHFTQAAISIPLTQGANDVTATAAELNLLDLAGLAVGDVLSADSATTASFKPQTGGSALEVEDESISLATAVIKLNFLGGGVTAVENATNEIDITIPGGGGGDVFKVGTPANDQIGVWTGDGTIEGNENLKWNGTVFSLESTGELQIASLFHGGDIRITAENLAGAEINLFTLDPDNLRNLSYVPLYFIGQAAAGLDFAGQGQFWVRDDAEHVPMFTSNFGTDVLLAGIGASGGANSQVAFFDGAKAIEGSSNFTYGLNGFTEQMMIQVVTNTINDVGILIIDSNSVLNPDGWGIMPGQSGLFDGSLILTDDPTDTVNNRNVTYVKNNAAAFGKGCAVANNVAFKSETVGALAFFMPIDNTGREETKISGVGEIGGTGHEGLVSIEVYAYGNSGLQFSRQAQFILDATGTIHADFYGTIDLGKFGDAVLSTGDNASMGYTSVNGLELTGQGSTNDVTIYNDARFPVIKIPTGTLNVEFLGDIILEGLILFQTFTDTELNDIADSVNTSVSKVQGAKAYNSTQDVPVWATGAADGSVWVDGAGTTVNTPV